MSVSEGNSASKFGKIINYQNLNVINRMCLYDSCSYVTAILNLILCDFNPVFIFVNYYS